MRFYRRPWDESRGDHFSDWGRLLWYFETNEDGDVTRQVEVYENGKILRYSEIEPEDEFGRLAEHPLDLKEFEKFSIDEREFEKRWTVESGLK